MGQVVWVAARFGISGLIAWASAGLVETWQVNPGGNACSFVQPVPTSPRAMAARSTTARLENGTGRATCKDRWWFGPGDSQGELVDISRPQNTGIAVRRARAHQLPSSDSSDITSPSTKHGVAPLNTKRRASRGKNTTAQEAKMKVVLGETRTRDLWMTGSFLPFTGSHNHMIMRPTL